MENLLHPLGLLHLQELRHSLYHEMLSVLVDAWGGDF